MERERNFVWHVDRIFLTTSSDYLLVLIYIYGLSCLALLSLSSPVCFPAESKDKILLVATFQDIVLYFNIFIFTLYTLYIFLLVLL